MKVSKLLLLVVLMAMVLAACKPAAPVVTEEPVKPTEIVKTEEPVQPVETEAPQEPVAEPVELRFTYYADGIEAEVMRPLLDKFTAENPNITVVLDVVPYQTIDEQLPVQVETGQGPDLARITNFAAYKGKYLDLRTLVSDPDYYQANFPNPIISALDFGGFPDTLTVTGPYINVTLFEQAGVAIPTGDTTWQEWTSLATEVAQKTTTQYAIGIDRTGHRVAGPAMSMGATLINADGKFTVDTPGFREFVTLLKSWQDGGLMPAELWLIGDSKNNCIDWIKSGDMVMCMTGSWQINGMAKDVADAFDWMVVPNPTGAGGSTGVAGGSAVVAFAGTKHPVETAKLMEFLYAEENYSAFSAGTLALPAHKGVALSGVAFNTDNPSVLQALSAYTAEVPKLQDQAVGLNVHPFAFAYYRNSANRIAQYLSGELTLDEMLINLQSDIDKAIAEAGG